MQQSQLNIIGFSGRVESGKDTSAGFVRELSDEDWEIKKFAAKLKQIASILTGIPAYNFEDQEFKKQELPKEWIQRPRFAIDMSIIPHDLNLKEVMQMWKENGPIMYKESEIAPDIQPITIVPAFETWREFLQVLGTECMRNKLHNNVWINALWADYWSEVEAADTETGWLITDVRFKNEAESIKERGGVVVRLRRNENKEASHPSETELDNYEFDYIIDNRETTLNELYEEVRKMLIHFKVKA